MRPATLPRLWASLPPGAYVQPAVLPLAQAARRSTAIAANGISRWSRRRDPAAEGEDILIAELSGIAAKSAVESRNGGRRARDLRYRRIAAWLRSVGPATMPSRIAVPAASVRLLDLELGEDMPDVDGDGSLADEQPFGDLAVRATLGQHVEHFELPWAEAERDVAGRRCELLGDLPRRLRLEVEIVSSPRAVAGSARIRPRTDRHESRRHHRHELARLHRHANRCRRREPLGDLGTVGQVDARSRGKVGQRALERQRR